MTQTQKEIHPLAELFPLMDGAPFDELVADIRTNGLRESIWTHQGKIIDGRNRYRACLAAGVEPTIREWHGKGTLTAFVVSMNVHRRHLSETQRGVIGTEIANATVGGDRDSITSIEGIEKDDITIADAAKLLNVGESTISKVRTVKKHAVPEIIQAMKDGKMSVNMAKTVMDLPADERREIAAKAKDGETIKPTKKTPPPDFHQSRGKGLEYGHRAIGILKDIPLDDGLRDEAFDLVTGWIRHNRRRIAAKAVMHSPAEEQREIARAAKHVERPSRKPTFSTPRGSFKEADEMMDTTKIMADRLTTIEGLRPKRNMTTVVTDHLRQLASRIEKLIARIEKEGSRLTTKAAPRLDVAPNAESQGVVENCIAAGLFQC